MPLQSQLSETRLFPDGKTEQTVFRAAVSSKADSVEREKEYSQLMVSRTESPTLLQNSQMTTKSFPKKHADANKDINYVANVSTFDNTDKTRSLVTHQATNMHPHHS